MDSSEDIGGRVSLAESGEKTPSRPSPLGRRNRSWIWTDIKEFSMRSREDSVAGAVDLYRILAARSLLAAAEP